MPNLENNKQFLKAFTPHLPLETNQNTIGNKSPLRISMVQKLARQGIKNPEVLRAINQIPRHNFVDTALQNKAYDEIALPIGFGQTISKPSTVARMIDLLSRGALATKIGNLGNVLEIGCGCGYQAAVLSQIAKTVHSIERISGLYQKAKTNLAELNIKNTHIYLADGCEGLAQYAPWTSIIAAASGEKIPIEWIYQLQIGGRLVAPVVQKQGKQALIVIDKTPSGIKEYILEQVQFVPLKTGVSHTK